MRLYLSSYRIGNHPEELLRLVGTGRKVAVIENALDHIPQETRDKGKKEGYNIGNVFQELGFQAENLDLRDYFDGQKDIEADLKKFDLIFSFGGNAFLLRRAMQQSGFDTAITKLLNQDALVYGGFSAGVCVLGKTLDGLELCDKTNVLAAGYNPKVITEGLGIIDYSIAPHYRSDHPETLMIEDVIASFEENQTPYVPMRDGDVIAYNGDIITYNGVISDLLKMDAGSSRLTNVKRTPASKPALKHPVSRNTIS